MNASEQWNDSWTPEHGAAQPPWAYEWFYHIPLLAIPLHGVLSPLLSVTTLVVNTLFCIVLLQPQMRNPTNLILAALSISNTLNGLVALPVYLYFYTFANYKDPMPFVFCRIDMFCYDYLPCVFHTASIFYTVALACQRYVHVCISNRWKQYICASKYQTIVAIVAIALISALLHVSNLLEKACEPVDVVLDNHTHYSGFISGKRNPWFVEHEEYFYPIYYWFRAICIHLLPCTILVIFNSLLFRTVKEAAHRRDQLLRSSTNRERGRKHSEVSITMMLVLVVTVFLVVEIPTAVILLLTILANIRVIEITINEAASMFANFAILISYPLSFLIYTNTSYQFRSAFKELLGFKTAKCEQSTQQTTISTARKSLLPRLNSKSVADSDNSDK